MILPVFILSSKLVALDIIYLEARKGVVSPWGGATTERAAHRWLNTNQHSPLSDSDRDRGFPSERVTGWLGSDGCCCSDLESWLSIAKERGLLHEVQATSQHKSSTSLHLSFPLILKNFNSSTCQVHANHWNNK